MGRFLGYATAACLALFEPGARGDDPAKNVPHASSHPEIPVLKIEKYELQNGLTVILHEDHKTPVAAVNLWYRVGSKDERAGRTGFAHLFEHMMFQGSQHHNQDYFAPLERLGADVNGSTAEDETIYYETVPSHALERALWLEADRMGFLLEAMTQERLDNQRDVVKNERRETVDNVPYGLAEEKLLEALYPPDHPYHHSVIGSMADLSAAGIDDVRAFFQKHYAPNRAILCVAGDFDPATVKGWIEKYFGPIPRGKELEPSRPRPVTLEGPRRVELFDRISLPRAQLVWPTVAIGDADEPALDVLAAILGGLPKENRLYKALQYERQLASQVAAEHPTRLLAGTFEIDLYARPTAANPRTQLDELVALADAEIARITRDGPTEAELGRARNQRESAIVMELQSVAYKASVLNQYLALEGDPLGFRRELERIFAVTAADVKRVAARYLGKTRVRVDVLPGPHPERAPDPIVKPVGPAPRPAPRVAIKDSFDRGVAPRLGSRPRFTPPRFARRRLSNGLELRVVERKDLPIVTFDLVAKAGESSTPAGKEGMASLAAAMLEEGTATHDSLAFAGALADLGASFAAVSDTESTTIGLTTLTRHVDRAMDLFAAAILAPGFPVKELDRLKLQRLARLKARRDDPERLAATIFPRLIYGPKHPYGRPDLGTPASIEAITRDDVAGFFRAVVTPENATLVVVGDVSVDDITARLEKRFGNWRGGAALRAPQGEPPAPETREPAIFLVDKPGAAQSVITIGRVAAARRSPDFHALGLLNSVLGGQFISRLNMNLREEKGYSYGIQSIFSFLRSPGPFEAGGGVQSAVTRESILEIMKELGEIAGPRPVEKSELEYARERLVQGFPSRFETTFGVAGQIAVLVEDELPDDEFETYVSKIEAVTQDDVNRVAKSYLAPESMTILVIGDRAAIEKPLAELPFGRVVKRLDLDGNPIAAGSKP